MITLKNFTKCIELLKKQKRHDAKFHSVIELLFKGSYAPIYPNDNLWESTILALEANFDNSEKFIDWWIYEADFGKRKDIYITMNGIIIDTSTTENFYNFLIENQSENQLKK